ncbi:MAG: hypothetical protein ACXWP0_12595 [Ktedonobacterales bacterium]
MNAWDAVAEGTLKTLAVGQGESAWWRYVIRGALERLQLESEALRQRVEEMQARSVLLVS